MKQLIFTFSAIALLAACTPKTTEVIEKVENPETIKSNDFPNGEIAEGDYLFSENCGKCHDLPKAAKYSEEKWRKIVPAMAIEAKLDATQENKILQYVLWKRTL
jgi:hypothetical protein